jgi:hypothetical protein
MTLSWQQVSRPGKEPPVATPWKLWHNPAIIDEKAADLKLKGNPGSAERTMQQRESVFSSAFSQYKHPQGINFAKPDIIGKIPL